MGYLDLEVWSEDFKRLTRADFSSMYGKLRQVNGAAAFNDAFFAPERLTDEEFQKFSEIFKGHIGLELEERLDAPNVFLLLMNEAIERSTRA